MKSIISRVVWALPGLALLLIIWWASTHISSGTLGRMFTPENALSSFKIMLTEGTLIKDTVISLSRVALGLIIALTVGVPVGLLIGCSPFSERLFMPGMQFLRMVSPLSWMPIAVMVLGVGDHPIWFLLSFAAVWPIILNTANGVRQLPPGWMLLAGSLSATRGEKLWFIILPGVRAHILTGIRLAIGILWIVLVPCEMLGVSSGLGYAILDARDRLDYSGLMALIVTIGAIGFLMDWLARYFIQTVNVGAR